MFLLLPFSFACERIVNANHLLRTCHCNQSVVITDIGSHHNVEFIAYLGNPIPCGQVAQDGIAVDTVAATTDQNQLAIA